MSYGIEHELRVYEECKQHADYEIDRLTGLCDALLQRETNSTGSETDSIREEIAKYRSQISDLEEENRDTNEKIRELKEKVRT